MGTHASIILYANPTEGLLLGHDGDPACVLPVLRDAFEEASQVSSVRHRRAVLLVEMEDALDQRRHPSTMLGGQEWGYALSLDGSLTITHYGEVFRVGHVRDLAEAAKNGAFSGCCT